MSFGLNRRRFLKHAAVAAGAVSAAGVYPCPGILRAAGSAGRVNCVVIGYGVRGTEHVGRLGDDNLVAMVDVDQRQHAALHKRLAAKGADAGKVQLFTDYRRMFDKIGKQIDAVFVATPNHHHASAALIAIELGKNVYCEKPLCHDVAEARRMAQAARRSKAATQMGIQGHCMEGYRRLCEYIWAGVIGNIRETHSWTNRCNGGRGPRPLAEQPPAGLNWDQWIGPAPYRAFHADLHPHEWHGWYDFGNGSIGNMGCHVLDGVFWALKVDHPTSIEVEEMRGGSNERYPIGGRLRWDIPARADMPPLKVYWYEGFNSTGREDSVGGLKSVKGDARSLPKLLGELQKQYPDEELDNGDSGTLYVGEKGIIHTGTYGERMHVVPIEKMKEIPVPPKTLPRTKNVVADFLEACRAGRTDTAVSFEYGTRLTEFALLGNLAQHAGPGKKLMWDGPKAKVTNMPELNAWVQRKNRKGWRL